jgi:CRP-like cAMP-binding protein
MDRTFELDQPASNEAAQDLISLIRKSHGATPPALTAADLDIAAQMPVLGALKPRAMAALLAEASVFNVRPGQALFRQGDSAKAFFIILDGWIKLYRITPAGDEAVLNVLSRGESLAEALTFASGHYPATAAAVSRARVLSIPADHVASCIREMPDVAIAMIASTSQHLQRMVQHIEQLTALSATQRVANFLLSLAACAKGPCTIVLPYDKSLIAGKLGLKPESLSRVFARLRSAGVEVRASHVIVRDMSRLRSLMVCDRTRAAPRGASAKAFAARSALRPAADEALA